MPENDRNVHDPDCCEPEWELVGSTDGESPIRTLRCMSCGVIVRPDLPAQGSEAA